MAVCKDTVASQVGGIDALVQGGEEVQVLVGTVWESAELDPVCLMQPKPAFLLGLPQCSLVLGLSRIQNTLGYIPIGRTGQMTKQQVAPGLEDQGSAADGMHGVMAPMERVTHHCIRFGAFWPFPTSEMVSDFKILQIRSKTVQPLLDLVRRCTGPGWQEVRPK